MKDLVIGAVTGYTFDQIAPWVNSLDRSGFDGYKALVAYNMDAKTIEELRLRGYIIIGFQHDKETNSLSYPHKDFSVVVERFLHYYLCLQNPENAGEIRFVLATDVKDVIFQKNPSQMLEGFSFMDVSMIASCEELTYAQEDWGANNMKLAFGHAFYEQHKDNLIYNAGVIAGRYETFLGACKTIYLMCKGAPQHVPGGGGPDQAAYNLLLSTPAYQRHTLRLNHNDVWAAQLGTTMDPSKIDRFAPHIKSGLPKYDHERELIVNPQGLPYAIVHQWDRVPEVRVMVERKYR